MPKSRTTWSQDEIEGLIREYLKRSGLRPVEVNSTQQQVEQQTDAANGSPKKRRAPKTFQWGFKPRVSISTEVEPDPDFSEDEYVCRCQRCGQVVISTRPPIFQNPRQEVNAVDVDKSIDSIDASIDKSVEDVDIDAANAAPDLLGTNLLPPGSAEAIQRAQEAKEEEQLRELHKKRQKVRGESDKRPY